MSLRHSRSPPGYNPAPAGQRSTLCSSSHSSSTDRADCAPTHQPAAPLLLHVSSTSACMVSICFNTFHAQPVRALPYSKASSFYLCFLKKKKNSFQWSFVRLIRLLCNCSSHLSVSSETRLLFYYYSPLEDALWVPRVIRPWNHCYTIKAMRIVFCFFFPCEERTSQAEQVRRAPSKEKF